MENEELKQQINDLEEYSYGYATKYGSLFATGLYNSGIIKDVTPEQLQQYFANPDLYQDIIADIAGYFYILSGEIHQLFEMVESLPQLNYKISRFDTDASTEKNIIKIKKAFHKLKHKRLTRDILKQTASTGNTVGVWLGKRPDIYPYIFNDFKHVKSGFRNIKGEWQIELSTSIFECLPEPQRSLLLSEFRPLMTTKVYNDIVDKKVLSFVVPPERTILTGTGKLYRNQFVGTSWVAPAMLDILHKRKLKDVEQTIANKIINSVAVLTVGSFDAKDTNGTNLARDYNKLPDKLVKDLHNNVKSALEKGSTEGISLITLPNFTDIKFPNIDSDGLEPSKFTQTNSDIGKGIGLSGAVLNGEGANYNSAKLNLEIFYARIGVMLEEIESVYQNFINLTLPEKYADNFYITYYKEVPLPTKEKLQHLKQLYDKGWSARTYIEELGYDFDQLWSETQAELKADINISLIPPPTSYTTNGAEIIGGVGEKGTAGAPTVADEDAEEETIRSRETQGSA